MQQLFKNKYVRFGGAGFIILVVLVIVAAVILASLNDARSDNNSFLNYNAGGRMSSPSFSMNKEVSEEIDMQRLDSSYYPPTPTPDGFTSNLEQYETTSYTISGRTKKFDDFCGTLTLLKADSQIHFKSLNSSTNNCNATFYVEEDAVVTTLANLQNFDGVETTRNTSSATRHKAQLQSQTSILKQQLSSIQKSLTAAETQFDEIAEFARQSKDAATLSQAIREKLTLIDNLTSRKINLTSQLNRLYQQAADLEERIDVIQFSVNITRSQPIYKNQDSEKWENAWTELKDTLTDTLIGITVLLGIFILWAIRIGLYLIVTLLVIWGLWKFTKLLWRKTETDNDREVDQLKQAEQE